MTGSKYTEDIRAKLIILAILDAAVEATDEELLATPQAKDWPDEALEAVARKHGLYPPPR